MDDDFSQRIKPKTLIVRHHIPEHLASFNAAADKAARNLSFDENPDTSLNQNIKSSSPILGKIMKAAAKSSQVTTGVQETGNESKQQKDFWDALAKKKLKKTQEDERNKMTSSDELNPEFEEADADERENGIEDSSLNKDFIIQFGTNYGKKLFKDIILPFVKILQTPISLTDLKQADFLAKLSWLVFVRKEKNVGSTKNRENYMVINGAIREWLERSKSIQHLFVEGSKQLWKDHHPEILQNKYGLVTFEKLRSLYETGLEKYGKNQNGDRTMTTTASKMSKTSSTGNTNATTHSSPIFSSSISFNNNSLRPAAHVTPAENSFRWQFPKKNTFSSENTAIKAQKPNQTTASAIPDDLENTINSLPDFFREKLYKFQKKGIEFGVKNCGRVLIADEKLHKWRNEIKTWCDKRDCEIQLITKSSTKLNKDAQYFVFSYDLAKGMVEQITEFGFQVVILDHAEYIGNPEIERTNDIRRAIKAIERVILLTGTLAYARPRELFNLLQVLRPDVFEDFEYFASRYCDRKENNWSGGYDYGALQNFGMIRRLKKEVLSELPEKDRHKDRKKDEVDTDSAFVAQIAAFLTRSPLIDYGNVVNDLMNQHFDDYSGNVYKGLQMCYSSTGQAKLKGIKQYIKKVIESKVKFLVFAYHKDVLDGIEEETRSQKVQYIRIDGHVESKARQDRVDEFQEREEVKVAILSLTACSVGLNLTAASTVIFAEMNWNPALMIQAEDCVHRLGQKEKNSINYHYLYGKGTLDELIYDKLLTKLAIDRSDIIDGEESLCAEKAQKGELNVPQLEESKTWKQNLNNETKKSYEEGKTDLYKPDKSEAAKDLTRLPSTKTSPQKGVNIKSGKRPDSTEQLVFDCEGCGERNYCWRDDLKMNFEYVDTKEREMGEENQYEAIENLFCERCRNEIIVTFRIWEYPIGDHERDRIEVAGGSLIIPVSFTIDFTEFDSFEEDFR